MYVITATNASISKTTMPLPMSKGQLVTVLAKVLARMGEDNSEELIVESMDTMRKELRK